MLAVRRRWERATLRQRVGIAATPPAAILIAALLLALWQPFHAEGHDRVVVEVPDGAGVHAIAGLLDRAEVVSSGALFEVRLTLAGKRGEVQAGHYTLQRGMSYGAAIDVLTTPPAQRVVTVTIPEGLSRSEVAQLVKRAGIDGDYERASRRSSLLNPHRYGGGPAADLEGFLFPATYELTPGASAHDLVKLQIEAFKTRFRELDLDFARSKNLTSYDVLTIASMVEREVSVPSERPLVAAVIYNRLHARQPLGIDATIRFALEAWDAPLTRRELEVASPYNTRQRAGLPPGPIGNPGLEAIKAATRPANSDAFYYVVKPDTCGEHTFSRTLAEHERAVAAYEQARRQNNGRAPTTCPDEAG